MKKVTITVLILLVILFSTLYINMPVANASLVSNVRSDIGTSTNPPTPSDSGGGSISPHTPSDPGGSEVQDIVETVYHYVGISGNVSEQLSESRIDYANTDIPEGGEIPNYKLGVANVMVQAVGPTTATTITDENGNYSFSGLSAGNYNLRFFYGKLDGNPGATTEENKRNILRYNGHDYITSKAPDGGEIIRTSTVQTTTETEIISAGRGCQQIYLVIDCSSSVRSDANNMIINGVSENRFDMIINSTKKLVHSLLSSGENIYIGLIFFSGTCYRAQGLTNNEAILTQHLNKVNENGWYTGGTDLVSALNKAESSFITAEGVESNRNIIILSDGVPTADGTHVIYSSDNDATILGKLESIKVTTKNKLRSLKDNGIVTRAIYIDPTDNDEKEFIRFIFDGDHIKSFLPIEEGSSFIHELTETLPQEIITSTEEREYQEYTTIEAGFEDPIRRNEVDNYYSGTFYYNNNYSNNVQTKLFEQIESSYEYDENVARDLSNKTYMIVNGGTFQIDGSGGGAVERSISN